MTTRRGSHLAAEPLLAIAEGGRPTAGQRAHLEACADCRGQRDEIERLIEDLRSEAAPEPPAAVLARARALWPGRPPARVRIAETIGRLVRAATDRPLAAGVGV